MLLRLHKDPKRKHDDLESTRTNADEHDEITTVNSVKTVIEGGQPAPKFRIFFTNMSALHENKHPVETKDRVITIFDKLRIMHDPSCFQRTVGRCTTKQILNFHTPVYLQTLNAMHSNPYIKMLRTQDNGCNSNTLPAAKDCASACIRALYEFDIEGVRAKFVIARPPGHHASTDAWGAWCFLNYAGITAKSALKCGKYQRVAVLDFDIHFGDGTAKGLCDDPRIFLGGK